MIPLPSGISIRCPASSPKRYIKGAFSGQLATIGIRSAVESAHGKFSAIDSLPLDSLLWGFSPVESPFGFFSCHQFP
jgi:hypothetical protein